MSQRAVIKYCFDRIVSQEKRPLFVGIAGDSGSGKSHYCDLLVKQFRKAKKDCLVINHDDFLIARNDREPMKTEFYEKGEFAGKSHWEVLENMFRLNEFQRVIDELKSGICSSYHPYSRGTGEVAIDNKEVRPSDFIFFDTSMMLHEMDFLILIEVDQETIIKRKAKRDSDIRTPEEVEHMHRKVQGYYWERQGPLKADIIIDNNDVCSPKVL